jgi:flagellar basal-body rod protein FlgF
MDGDTMLSVQADDGSEAYTRRGDLKMSDSGLLTTGDGKPVLGDGGPITLPPYDSLSIGKRRDDLDHTRRRHR